MSASRSCPRSRSSPRRRSTITAARPRARSRSCSTRTRRSLRSSAPRAVRSAPTAITSVSSRASSAFSADSACAPSSLAAARAVSLVRSAAMSRPARCTRRAVSSPISSPWRRAASACRSSGRSWRRTSRRRSCTRTRLASVASRRRSAFSLRLRYLSTPAASSTIARRSSGRALSTASIWPWLTITCCWRPTPASDSSSWTSSRRQGTSLMAYSLSPVRKSVRRTVTSLNSMPSRPAELSMVRLTSARPRGGRDAVPAKITSSIFWLRTALGAWAPSTHAMASTTLDLPDPLGPTTTVTPGSSSSVVASANDLKPLRVRLFKNTARATIPALARALEDGQAPAQRGARWQNGHQ